MAAQTQAYDDDHIRLSVTLPGRGTTTYARKTDGRQTGAGDAMFGYADATSRISSATRGAKTDAFGYDGSLKTTAAENTYGYAADTHLESIRSRATKARPPATKTACSPPTDGSARSAKARSATSARSQTMRRACALGYDSVGASAAAR